MSLTLDILSTSSNGSTILVWKKVGGADSFEIWRSINGSPYALLATVSGSTLSFTDTGMLAAGDEWDYQVRGIKNGVVGPFSIPAGALNNYNANPPGAPGSVTISFPNVVMSYGTIGVSAANASVGQFNAPRLHDTVGPGTIDFQSVSGLRGFNFNSLRTVGNDINFSLGDTSLLTASFPALVSIVGDIDLSGATALTAASFSALVTCGLFLNLQSCPALTSISCPALAFIGNDLMFFGDTTLPSVSFPSLTSIGSVAGGNLTGYSCPTLASASFPVLASIGGFIDFSGDTALTTLSFPVLTTLQTGITCGPTGGAGTSATNLVTVSIPNLIFPPATSVVDFHGCSLNVASVNGILRRCALSLPGMNACDIELGGGTNAAPTGQGLVDKAALIAAGNTVNTN